MDSRYWLLAILFNLSVATAARAADEVGESLITPNQQKRVVRVNQDLPHDIRDQARDSRKVAELRGQLRVALSTYRQAVQQFGPGTTESRQAAHQVLETQKDLHKQFVKEEAIPAISQLPQ